MEAIWKKNALIVQDYPSRDHISEVFSENGHADFIPTDHDTATWYSNSDIEDEGEEEQMADYNYLYGKKRFKRSVVSPTRKVQLMNITSYARILNG